MALAAFIFGAYLAYSARGKFRYLQLKKVPNLSFLDLSRVVAAPLLAFASIYLFTQNLTLVIPLSIVVSYLPRIYQKNRMRKLSEERRKSWPLVVDQLASATSSGVALHQALIEMVNRGPAPQKKDFLSFRESFVNEGSLERALESFVFTATKDPLNGDDRTAQRLKSTILVVRDCGGQEVGPILRNLSNHLRQRERALNDIAIKQDWIKNGAVLASLAPWLLLLILSFHSQTVSAYNSLGGRVVLGIGLSLTFVAYKWITLISESISQYRAA